MRGFQARGVRTSHQNSAPRAEKCDKPLHSQKGAAPEGTGPLGMVFRLYQLMAIVIVVVAVVEPDVPVMVTGGVVPVIVMFSAPLLDAWVYVSPM